jgi:AraC-like DNA-binding protein
MLTLLRAITLTQGLFLASVLWFHPGHRAANRWLAGAMIAFSLITLSDVLSVSGAISRVPHLAYIFDWMIFLIGPFLYQYVVAATRDTSITWQQRMAHLIPASLVIAFCMPIYQWSAADKLRAIQSDNATTGEVDLLLVAAALHVLLYMLACLLQARRFSAHLKTHYSNLDSMKSKWLTTLILVNLIVWGCWFVAVVAGARFAWVESIASSIAVYGLGYAGLRYGIVFGRSASANTTQNLLSQSQPPTIASEEIGNEKYAKSTLRAEQFADYQKRIVAHMEIEKPYLEPNLTLRSLADQLLISPHHLSQVFSSDMNTSFYDYINRCRVVEVQRCLDDPSYNQQTILEIALAAGFSSKATFNNVFKNAVGVTPSNYRSSASERSKT